MILEGVFEQRTVREYARLKEEEQRCFEDLDRAAKENDEAWDIRDLSTIKEAGQALDNVEARHDNLQKELNRVGRTLMEIALNALQTGKYVDEGGTSL